MSILLFFVYLIFGDISIWWCNFFGSQAKKLNLSSSLSSSLAWLINQPELKLFGILTNLSSNIVFRLVSSSSQAWAFDFYWRAKLKHTLLDKAWIVYSPNLFESWYWYFCFTNVKYFQVFDIICKIFASTNYQHRWLSHWSRGCQKFGGQTNGSGDQTANTDY